MKEYNGRKVRMLGKYDNFLSKILCFADSPLKARVEDRSFNRVIFGLSPRKDNVYVYGEVVSDSKYGHVILVKKITKAPPDAEIFAERARKIDADDAGGLEELAARAKKRAEKYRDPELLKLAEEMYEKALETAERLAKGDAEKLVALADKYLHKLHDMHKAIKLYQAALEIRPRFRRAEDALKDLECRKYKGRWLTPDEYMRAEGLVQHRGEWITPLEKEFVLVVEERRKNPSKIIRSFDKSYFETDVEDRKLLPGMTPNEVVKCWGFAEKVVHKKFDSDKYTMWIFKNGNKTYFENNVLFKWNIK